MTILLKQEISKIIGELCDDDKRLSELLTYCVGRTCLKMALHDQDWKAALHNIDLRHIVDWLKAAVINNESWLKDVDSKDRPKKLMKFGSLQDIVREADKAMFKSIQRNGSVDLIEGDEELYMELENGYRLVRLLTSAALDLEGKEMQHCIGGGSYDEKVENADSLFLSLRDAYNKRHATLEVENNVLTQFQGKQNETPHHRYALELKPYFRKYAPAVDISNLELGYVVSEDGEIYELDSLPEVLSVRGCLDLDGANIDKLPKKLTVGRNLSLRGTSIASLPTELNVGGSLYLTGSSIEMLPEGLMVGGGIHLDYTLIKSLPKNLYIRGDLVLSYTPIESLPDGLHVGQTLNLNNSKITSLPPCLQVEGTLNLFETSIRELPEGLHIGRSLDIRRTNIVTLPKGLHVGHDVYATNSNLKNLNNDLKVGNNLYLEHTDVEIIPEGVVVGKLLNISGTSITNIPASINDLTIIDAATIIQFAEDYRLRDDPNIDHKAINKSDLPPCFDLRKI